MRMVDGGWFEERASLAYQSEAYARIRTKDTMGEWASL